MSMPEPRTTDSALVTPSPAAGQLVRRPSATPTRTMRACRWLGWHFGELAAIGGTGTLAVTFTPWWAVGSVAVGMVWAASERRTRRGKQRGELR